MSPNRSPAFFAVAALLLLAAAAPLALAQAPPPPQLVRGPYGTLWPAEYVPDALQIAGVLCCTPSGQCPGGPRIAGVNYKLICHDFFSFVMAKGSTGVNGDFTVTFRNVAVLVDYLGTDVISVLDGAPLPCRVVIDLPIDRALGCPALDSVNGSLYSPLFLNGIYFTQGLGRSVNYYANFQFTKLHV